MIKLHEGQDFGLVQNAIVLMFQSSTIVYCRAEKRVVVVAIVVVAIVVVVVVGIAII